MLYSFKTVRFFLVTCEQTHVDIREGSEDTARIVHVTSEDRWESGKEENQEPVKNVFHTGRIVLIRNTTFGGDTKWVKDIKYMEMERS